MNDTTSRSSSQPLRPPGSIMDLNQAIETNQHAKVSALLEQHVFPQRLLGTALLHGVMNSVDIDILLTLLRAGAPPESDRGMAMMAYASMGSLDGLEMLAEAGMPVSNAYQAATIAAASGNVDLLRFFIEGGVSPDADSGGMILAAAQSGSTQIVAFLVEECGVSLNEIGTEALEEACLHEESKAVPLIEFLLSKGVSPHGIARAQAIFDRMHIEDKVGQGASIRGRIVRSAPC